MSVLARLLPSAPPAPAPALARGDVFFTRRVPLAEGEPAAAQLSLAIEGLAPFPPEQLYYGHVPTADGREALVFAAFRRRFTADEAAGWDTASRVTPEFVALLAAAAPADDEILLHRGATRLTALARRRGAELPEAVVSREGGDEIAATLLNDLRARAGFSAHAPVRELTGELELIEREDGSAEARCAGEVLGEFSSGRLAGADVRDPGFLIERRRSAARDLWLWRGMIGVGALLGLALLLELGASAVGWKAGRMAAQVTEQAEAVRQTETAKTLANRIGELSERRLMAFEMLALINPARPESVIFQKVATRGLLGLEVEATATRAEDVGDFTTALRGMDALAEATTRVDGARDGVTRFVVTLKFKPEALKNGGAQ